MIKLKEFNTEFESQDKAFAALKASKAALISLKKSTVKSSDPLQLAPRVAHVGAGESTKADGTLKDLSFGDYVYPIINTTNYLDSHQDVHLPGLWTKSLPEQTGKTFYVVNHALEIGSVISYPEEVEILTRKMFWRELGKDYDGQTEALIFKAKLTEKSQRDAYLAFKDRVSIQNSIRMQYVTLELAVNDGSEDYREEKAIFDKYISQIANKGDAIAAGYFWAVTEARIYKEGSAVLFGSNDATPMQYDMKDTKVEPAPATPPKPSNGINISKILSNSF